MAINELQKKGLTLIFFTALVSGVSIFINSFGVKGFDSSVFTFSKNVIVGILLFSIILGTGLFSEIKKLNKKNWYQLIVIGLIGGSIPFLLFFKGLQLTTGTTGAFIHKTLLVYVGVFAIIFLKEKLTKGLFLGAIFLIIGNFLMLKPSFIFSVGHVLILCATILWAAENTYAKHVLKNINGTIIAFGRMFFGSLFILIYLLFTGKTNLILLMSFQQYSWILITAAFLLFYVIAFYNGLKYVKVTTAACILSLGAPITTGLSILFYSTPINVFQSLGMLLILAGIISVIWFYPISSFVLKQFGVKSYGRS